MTESFQRILGRALLVLLVAWGGFATLQFFAVGVHQSVLLDDAGKQLVSTACEGRGFLCNGLFTLPASIVAALGQLSPFVGYIVLSVVVLAALAIRTFMRSEEWRLRVTLSPLIVFGLFVLAAWGLLVSVSFSSNDGLPMTRVIEPSTSVYPGIDAESLADLRANFDDLMSRGCLSPRGTTVGGAAVYDYRFWCVQAGFATRVLPHIALLALFAFNVLVLGRAALHLLRLRNFPLLAEGVLSAGLGACLLVAILWVVAMLGLYTSAAGWVLLVAIPAVGFVHSRYWAVSAWRERWSVDLAPWSLTLVVAWLLVSYLAFNFVSVVRPFPIGWDDLGRYLNQPRLLVSYGHFIPTLATFSWEYLTSLGFLLFGYDSVFGATLSMLINWSAGVLAVLTVWLFGRAYLGSGKGLLSALVFYTLPMVGHFSFADMKVDNAIFAIGTLAAFAVFLAVVPPDGVDEDDPEHASSVLPLLALAGVFAGFAFGMKPTSTIVIMAAGAAILGARLGWTAFLGTCFLAFALFTKQGTLRVAEVSGKVFGDTQFLSPTVVFAAFAIVGLAFIGWSLRPKLSALRELGMKIGVFALAFAVTVAPWLVSNNVSYGYFPPRIELSHANNLAPVLLIAGGQSPRDGALVKSLPEELRVDPSNPACVATSKEEELDRYWGNHEGIGHYLGLPWRAVMNLDAAGYYVTLAPALLLVPLLLLLPFFWTRGGRWMRFLFGATVFMVVQWMFLANGVIWYGVNMFLGLVVLVEALVVLSPTPATRRIAGTLVAISLLTAYSHRMWQFGIMQSIYEYPMGKVSAATMEERTIPHYDDVRDEILRRREAMPDRPYVYRMGTFIPYFIPKNFETFPIADNQLDMFNCLFQERDPAKTLARLQALGFNSMIFDTNTHTIETDENGSLHRKVQAFMDFANAPGTGIRIVVNDPSAGIAFILLP